MKAEAKINYQEKKKYAYITIPRRLFTDSKFPFKPNEEVEIEIVEGALVIRKAE